MKKKAPLFKTPSVNVIKQHFSIKLVLELELEMNSNNLHKGEQLLLFSRSAIVKCYSFEINGTNVKRSFELNGKRYFQTTCCGGGSAVYALKVGLTTL